MTSSGSFSLIFSGSGGGGTGVSDLEEGADRKTLENIDEKVETVVIAGLANSFGGGGGGGADEVYVSRRMQAEMRTSGL